MPGMNEIVDAACTHPMVYREMKREHTGSVILAAQISRVEPVESAVLRYHWYEPDRRRDLDNIAAAAKFVNDGLVAAKILKSDGWHHIKGIEHRFYVDKESPRVEVELIVEEDEV
jgi:hypothetical protein|tara:strand:- start:1919 stop:2263 length:345 start_codon:yes stop_codon:yes gene_type:complete